MVGEEVARMRDEMSDKSLKGHYMGGVKGHLKRQIIYSRQAGKGGCVKTYQGLLVSQSLPLRRICSHWHAVTDPRITTLDTPAFPVVWTTPYTPSLLYRHARAHTHLTTGQINKETFSHSPQHANTLVRLRKPENTDNVLLQQVPLQMIQRLRAIHSLCRTNRRRSQTGGQSRAKPSAEAVRDAALSFIRTADT